MSNFFVQELVLYRHFMLIDSPIPFELVANPTNYRKDEHGNILNSDLSEITGRDICSRPAGAWRVDCWTLLPEQYHKQNPVFTMLIKYDRDLLEEGEIVDIRYSDIDIGDGVAGINGQLVDIPASAFRPVVNAIESASASIVDRINLVTNSIHSTIEQGNGIMSGISSDTDIIRSNVGDMSLDVGEIVRLLGSLDSGTVLNELEQIRTVLKRPATATAAGSTPWDSILNALLGGDFHLRFVFEKGWARDVFCRVVVPTIYNGVILPRDKVITTDDFLITSDSVPDGTNYEVSFMGRVLGAYFISSVAESVDRPLPVDILLHHVLKVD